MFFVKIDDKFVDEVIKPAIDNLEKQLEKIEKYSDSLGFHPASTEPNGRLISLSSQIEGLKSHISLYNRFGGAFMNQAELQAIEHHLNYDASQEIKLWRKI